MKNQSGALLHFSGYPLRIANAKPAKSKETRSNLRVAKSEMFVSSKNEMVNNPRYWDIDWFCNYE